ncbi:hypothetical protein CAC42_1865 [Sphaceloma murrayae]|uniref:Alpha-L-arabinofuranosidase n=1 Tax=Sphaceloma murrayae TaxID=2082308 RepID=A0A2K1QVT6_9PEZI|nr:hypothetical protein CAC42_1865 [Sphaceloma murrayae]
MKYLLPLLSVAATAVSSALPAPRAIAARAAAAPKPLPTTYSWKSTGPLLAAEPGSGIAGIKDPSVVLVDGTYHVFASTARASGYSLIYTNFTSFENAAKTPYTYLNRTAIGSGYRAAPEVFYFAPQKLWYLIYQNGNAAYSTNPDISNPMGWTAPKNFYNGTPAIITENIGNGHWVDMWVICDNVNCHLFSSDDNGHLYRSQTTRAKFPQGMSTPVIALEDADRFRLFEASNVYWVADNDAAPEAGGQYLLLVEAIGAGNARWFRSWTSTTLDGTWTPLAAEPTNPFLRNTNVVFQGAKWTNSISHGELVRTNVDEKLRVSRCGWQYMYQGVDPAANQSYNALPWKLALATQTSTC